MNRNSRRLDVLNALRANPSASLQELCDATGIKARSAVIYHLNKLEAEGTITRERYVQRGISFGAPAGFVKKPKKSNRIVRGYVKRNKTRKANNFRNGNVKMPKMTDAELNLRIEAIGQRNDEAQRSIEPVVGGDVVRSNRSPWFVKAHKVG